MVGGWGGRRGRGAGGRKVKKKLLTFPEAEIKMVIQEKHGHVSFGANQ